MRTSESVLRWMDDHKARMARQLAIIAHNREMMKLRVSGQAYRDKLISERLKLRREA